MQGDPARPSRRGHLFVISAPSGAGKTSLIHALVESDHLLQVSISYTTRPRREAETSGVHYYFVDPKTFAAMRDGDEFLEWASVFDHAYGTSRRAVEEAIEAGRDVILEIDWQGAAQIRACWPEPVSIFVLPPSRRALIERLTRRGQDTPATIVKRAAQAVADMSHHGEFDYLVVNDDFEAAVDALRRIVQATRDGELPPAEDHSKLLAELLSTPPAAV